MSPLKDPLRAFRFHGLLLDSDRKEPVADCPFCSKESHLYVSRKTGQFNCKACGRIGNAPSFLRQLWEGSLKQTSNSDYRGLSKDRGIPVEVLKAWGLAKSLLTEEWLIPGGIRPKSLANLYVWRGKDGSRKLLSSSECSLHLLGDNGQEDQQPKTIWVTEGPWDGMAGDAILRTRKLKTGKTLRETTLLVALPGAGSCHKELAPLCKDRDTALLLDNDEAGRKGTASIVKLLGKEGIHPKSLRVLQWPDSLPDGYDLRDLLKDKGPKDAYHFLKDNLQEQDPSSPEDDQGELHFVAYSDIERKDVDWLWQERVPFGKITVIQGNAGLGKTFVLLDIMARLSRGKPFPDGTPCPLGRSLFYSLEDDPDDTIGPRLDKLGADPSKICHFDCVERDGKEHSFDLAKDIAKLDAYLTANPEVRLIGFDPLPAYLGRKTDSHKNADVRRDLGPLYQLARRHRVAIIGVNHLTKNEGMKAIHRGQGSVALAAFPRAVWQVSEDPDDPDRRLFLRVKVNNGKRVKGLVYRITDAGIVWEGPTDLSADEAENGPNDQGDTRLDEAKDWLSSLLEREGPLQAKDVFDRAKDDRISVRTLKRAKKELNVQSARDDKGWVWSPPRKLPEGWKGKGADDFRRLVKVKKAKRVAQ